MDETNTSERAQSQSDRRSVLKATGVAVVSGALFTGSATAQLPDGVSNSTADSYDESLERAEAAETAADEYDFEPPAEPTQPEQDNPDESTTEYGPNEVSQHVSNESVQSSNESVEINEVSSNDGQAVSEDVSTDSADVSSVVSDELDALSDLAFGDW